MAGLRDLFTRIRFQVDAKPLEKLQGTVEKVKSRLDLLAAGELLRGLGELAEKFGGFAIDLQNSATAAGLTAEALQGLQFAAGEAGLDAGELSKSLTTLTKKMQAARLGSEEANIAFGRAGITPDQLGSFRNSSDALKALANSLRNIQDPVAKAAAAQDVLGESGARMLNFLQDGAEGLDEASEKAQKLGIIVTTGQLNNLAAAERSMGVFKKQLTAMAEIFAAKAAPAITKTVQALGQFLASHRKLINTTLDRWLYNIGYAMGYATVLFQNMGKVFDALIEKFPNAAGFAAKFVVALFAVRAALAGLGYVFAPVFWAFRAFKLVLTPFAKLFNYAFLKPMRGILNLGGRIASGLMSGFGRLFAYLFPRLASWVVSTYAAIAPYLLVAAAIAAIVVVSHDLWTMWKGGKFEDTWIGQALKAVKSFGGKIWDKLGFSMPDFGSGDAQTADGASVASKLSDHASAMMDTTDHMVQRQGPKAAQALTGTVVHQGGDNKTVSYTINAPVTINAPSADAGTTRQLTAHVQDAIKDTWETILSSTKTAATPAADY